MKVLEVKNLQKRFDEKEVLKDISFSVEVGETLVILGASGSGKSTLLRCIAGLEKIDGGHIEIGGEKMVKEYKKNRPVYNDKKILEKINQSTGMVFQDFQLFPHLTVEENVMLALRLVRRKREAERKETAYALLAKMNLLDRAKAYPCNLSGGQKQRAAIARCLAMQPKIICMDEPTSSLDPELTGEVLSVIQKLAQEKKTMVIVTHEIKFAEEVASRVIFMADGRILEAGTPAEVIRNPQKARTKEFLRRVV